MTYLSPLYQELRADIRPPTFAANALLSDTPLRQCYDRRLVNDIERRQKSEGHNWLDAHELVRQSPDGSLTWTHKGELYRARIRSAGIASVTELWQWSRSGNGPSVWRNVGRPWS